MMQKLIVEMKKFQETLNSKESIKKLVSYYGDKFYVLIFLKQYERLLVNMKSIGALLEIDSIEDSYTIFRKYIETYSIMMSVYENRSVVKKYMIHDSYIGYKACGEKKDEIKKHKEKIRRWAQSSLDRCASTGQLNSQPLAVVLMRILW